MSVYLKDPHESLFLQLHNLLANHIRELFKPSKDAKSFPAWIIEKLGSLRFCFFVGDKKYKLINTLVIH